MKCLFKTSIVSICICVYFHAVGQEPKGVDSLRRALTVASGKNKLPILNQLNLAYRDIKADSGLRYANLYYDLALDLGDSAEIVQGGRMQAYSLMDFAKNREALAILKNVLGIAQRNSPRNPELKSKIKFILNNIGIIYTDLGNYDKALDSQFRSLRLREEEGNKALMQACLNNIGLVFYNLNDFERSLEYFLRAQSLAEELKNTKSQIQTLPNIGLCLIDLKKPEEALSSYERVLSLCASNCDESTIKVVHQGIAVCFHDLGNLEKAKAEASVSLQAAKRQNDMRYISEDLELLGRIESESGNFTIGLEHLKEAHRIAETHAISKTRWVTCEDLSNLYKKMGDYRNSLLYREKYAQLKDSIYTGEALRRIADVQADYLEQKNIRTLNEKDQLLLLKEELIGKQKEQTIYIAGIAFLLLIVVILLYKFYRDRVTLSLRLDKKVKERTEELRMSNDQLTGLLNIHKAQVEKSARASRIILERLHGLCYSAKLEENIDTRSKSYLEMVDKNLEELNQVISQN